MNTDTLNDIKVGSKIRFSTTLPDGGIASFSVRVVKLMGDGTAWVEFPKRALALPFPPNDGKRFALHNVSFLKRNLVKEEVAR